jgi:hypothetical protein
MEVEAMRRMVNPWEDDAKITFVMTDEDSKMAKVIRESRWNVRHKYDAHDTKKALDGYCQELTKEERQLLHGLGKPSRNRLNHALHRPITPNEKIEMSENGLNRYFGDHSKCDHSAHLGYQWKNRRCLKFR